jgi:hypothetical protein
MWRANHTCDLISRSVATAGPGPTHLYQLTSRNPCWRFRESAGSASRSGRPCKSYVRKDLPVYRRAVYWGAVNGGPASDLGADLSWASDGNMAGGCAELLSQETRRAR